MPHTSTPIAPGANPFFLPGGSTGVVIIHGYGGSIGDYRSFGEHLHAQGHTVLGLRLAGHGQDLETLRQSTVADWRRSVDVAVEDIRRTCSTVVLVGSSFGGTLAIDYVERHPDRIAGLVAVNPVVRYTHARLQKVLLSILRFFTPYYPKLGLSAQQKAQYRQLGSSTAWPIDGLFATEQLVREDVWPRLSLVRLPILFLVNDKDPIVSSSSVDLLRQQLTQAPIERRSIPGKTHRPFRDPSATVFMASRVDDFIRGLATRTGM